MSDFARPIASWAAFDGSDLVVRGSHLAESGTVFHLTWYDGSWALQSATVTPSQRSAGWGASHGRSPMLDHVRLPFDQSNLAPHFYVHIGPEGPGGLQTAHTYSMGFSPLVLEHQIDLGMTKSLSRPHVSNDSPFSESHFKIFEYRPGFPDCFGSQEDALIWRGWPD